MLPRRLHQLAVAIGASLLLIGSHAPSAVAAGIEVLSASDVIDRALNALGGRSKLERVSSIQAAGHVTLLGGFTGRYEMQAQRPDRLRTAWNITYISQVRAFDGQNGWERNASVRELAGDALERIRDEAMWMPLLSFDEAHTPVSVTELPPSSLPGVAVKASSLPRRYRLDFQTSRGLVSIGIDADSFLPIEMSRTEPFEEGQTVVVERYADYRSVKGLVLPFHIERVIPDLPSAVTIDRYTLNPWLSREIFENPNTARMQEPYELSLATIPRRVFKTPRNQFDDSWRRYWGIPFPPMERWILDFVIDERFGRYMVPENATLTYFAKESVVGTETLTGTALQALLKFPVTRFAPQSEIYNLRLNGLQYANLHIDRVRLDFAARGRDTQLHVARLDVPLEAVPTEHPVLFPVRGPFVIRTGHDFQELSHTYEWSQQYAYDITCVGPHFELTTAEGLPHRNEDFAAFGKCDILAPDDGVVVYARNDVSDDSVKAKHLRMAEPLWTIAGNIVLIRHPNGTCSLLAHMHEGSVLVKTGDHVTKGQSLGRLGASGAPGFPHVHFQLQTSENLFDGDGLPVTFENIRRLNGDHVPVPDLGGYYIAE